MAFEKASSLEAATTEAEVNELIDFTIAELNRRVGRAGFSPGQRVFGRQLRLPPSLLEDDFIDPYMIAQDPTHEMRRSEAMRMAAAHGCVVAADRRPMSTASHSRQRKPQRALVAGEPVFMHRRKDGAQEWCGPGVCVLSEEPKPGRNETVWVHMRNCLHKCNRTQVRPATNEEGEGIETVTLLLPSLIEARDTSPTLLTREILRAMSQRLWKAMSWTFAWEDLIRSRNLSSMQLQIPTPHHAVPDQKPTRSPRSRSRLQLAVTWRLESVIAEFDFEKKEILHPRTGSRWRNRVGKRQNEPKPVNPLFLFIPPKQARPSSPECSCCKR